MATLVAATIVALTAVAVYFFGARAATSFWVNLPWVTGVVDSGWTNFWELKPETQLSAFQLLTLVVAAVWALVLYHRRRQGQATIRIATSVRVAPDDSGDRLFVRSHIANESAVDLGAVQATITLIDVGRGRDANTLELRRVAAQDALLPVTGEMLERGGVLTLTQDKNVTLEPGECVESEVLFDLGQTSSLLALRTEVEGEQRTFLPRWWRPYFSGTKASQPWGIRFREWYIWGSYALIEPRTLPKNGDYRTITMHDSLAG
jgi:hypothetical protein